MTSTLYKNFDHIVIGDANATLLSNVDLLQTDGAIVAIGTDLVAPDNTQQVDCSGLTAYPGLVNTHHHFFQAFVRNQRKLDWTQLNVIQWLDLIYPLFALIDEDCIYQSSIVSMADLIKHGCTTAFDHQYNYSRHAGKFLIDRQFEAAELLGMRYVAGRGSNTLPKSEGSTIPDEMREDTDEVLADCERLVNTFHQRQPLAMRQIVLAPCQPINAYPETFIESAKLARDLRVSLHTHLGEGECEPMRERFGMRSLDWCEQIDFVGPDVWFAHGWEFTPDEIKQLAASNTGLSHCPSSVFLVGADVTNLPAMQAAGVRISLGADGAASNDNSDLAECVRQTYLLQCLSAAEREHPVPSPYDIFRMGAQGGADCLNRPDLGSLEVGKAADFFAVNLNRLEYVGASHDPLSLPAKVGFSSTVDMTVINGKIVWKDGEFPGLDEGKLARDAKQVFEQVIFHHPKLEAVRAR